MAAALVDSPESIFTIISSSVNFLSPKSDQHQTSHNTNTYSREKVMRIKK